MKPLHEFMDWSKLALLAQSMRVAGWDGVPLVIMGEQLVTGSHRYAAAKRIGWSDDDIPTIALKEVFAEDNLDFDALHKQYGSPTVYCATFGHLIDELDMEIILKYGIEIW